MGKYERAREELETTGETIMKSAGNSMQPILGSKETLRFRKQESYVVGDIVFCKVRGRWIDAHKITKKDGDRYMISNNHGHDNGWTRQIYGKVIEVL